MKLTKTGEDILLVIEKEGRVYGWNLEQIVNSTRHKSDLVHRRTFYRTLESLEKKELICQSGIEKQDKAPDRKYYALTEVGMNRVKGIEQYRKSLVG